MEELLKMPVWQMTGEQFLALINRGQIREDLTPQKDKKRYVYGQKGIADIFGCSVATASRIKSSGKIDAAIKQIGRKIIVDSVLALELAGKRGRR